MFRKVCVLVGLIVSITLFTTCRMALNNSGEGTVVLSIAPGGMLTSRTIEPSLSMDPAFYNIYGVGPAGMTFERLGVTPGGVVQASLTPGDWLITVDAYNDDDPPVRIGTGEATVTVRAGRVQTVIIDVMPLPDAGQLLLGVTWPENVLLDPVVTGVLTPLGEVGEDLAFTNAGDDLSATYSSPDMADPDALASGYYTLALTLKTEAPDGSGLVKAWGTLEAVRIVAGEISEKTYELVEDVNHGGVVINPEMDNPITISLSGVVDPLTAGSEMTVVAEPAGETSYQWYLDGVLLENGANVTITGNTITFGKDVGLGYRWLSVIVTSGSVISSTEEQFQVVQTPGGSSLWGAMVWDYDVWG